ncbi:hypothetical protein CHS0354_039710 [Potamilus streckersoni]|uniref:Uncharacterized protein n=1 Tax=Potamilus streckersoni TaxID=2493646 RepID=A0AAE0VTY7_9BIVA|nr:hypothetical protein CHS0354_039710 [Potamilus streckersoni]
MRSKLLDIIKEKNPKKQKQHINSQQMYTMTKNYNEDSTVDNLRPCNASSDNSFEARHRHRVLIEKVSELETNQQECGSYQSNMLLELTYVKKKLEQSERRISELEAIVYDMGYHEYTENLSVTMENDTVDKPTNKTVTKFIKEEKYIRRAAEPKRMYSHQSGNSYE